MSESGKSYGTASSKKLEKSRVEITGSIPADIWGKYRAQARKTLNESVTIDGFRKGMIPENILIAKVGEMALLEEMAELALSKAYIDILIDNKIDAIGRPHVSITKLARDNPLEFKITTYVVPEVTLPDYRKIAEKVIEKHPPTGTPKGLSLTPEELENTITHIRKTAASKSKAPVAGTGGPSPDEAQTSAAKSEAKTDLPELTDDFVKTLGAFTDVADFKSKISAMLIEEKKSAAHEKSRLAMADALVDASNVDLPEVLVESELSRTETQFRSDIERMGVKMEDYIKHTKKTLDDIRKEWRPHAEKKAKLQLILNSIAEKEGLTPSVEDVEHEVKHLLEHHKDADREHAHAYAETVLTNEKVFRFLENRGESGGTKTL